MKKQSFIYGAMILFLASLINRLVGFGYQMVVIRLIKPEGVGLFNMVYPVYVMALVLSSMGIPLAIAKLVAQEVAKGNQRGAYQIFYISLVIIGFSSTLITIALFWSAPLLVEYYFPNPKVYYSFLALIPGIIVVSFCSAFRGFFQGLQQMTPTAITQILEQLVRVSAGLTIAYFLLPWGVEYAAIGISLGVVSGEIVGCITMVIIYFRARPYTSIHTGHKQQFSSILGQIFSLGIPVTLTRFASTALMSIDAIMIPQRLQASGLSLQQATSTYGQLVGIAQTLLFTPAIITIALATALVPAVSDALAQNNIKLVQARTTEAVRLTITAGLPCVVLLLCLPYELCGLLFGYREAGSILRIIALGGTFLYFSQTTTGILQGMGEAVRPFKNMLIASSFKIVAIYYLTSVSWLGIRGTAISIAIYYMLMACLNYWDLKRLINFNLYPVNTVVKPLCGALVMVATIFVIKSNLALVIDSWPVITFSIILLSLLLYIGTLLLVGGVQPQDIDRLKRAINRIIPRR